LNKLRGHVAAIEDTRYCAATPDMVHSRLYGKSRRRLLAGGTHDLTLSNIHAQGQKPGIWPAHTGP
jgi:hypothetical protein